MAIPEEHPVWPDFSEEEQTPLSFSDGNMARFRNARNKRAGVFIQNFEYSRERIAENGSDFNPAQIAGNQNENPCPAGTQCRNLKRPISEPLVFRQDYPTTLAYFLEPHSILFIPLKVIVMDFYRQSRFAKRATYGLDAQRSVNEENCPFRRLRSGWLLRRHWFPIGSRLLDLRQSRRPCSARKWQQLEYRYQRRQGVQRKRSGSLLQRVDLEEVRATLHFRE